MFLIPRCTICGGPMPNLQRATVTMDEKGRAEFFRCRFCMAQPGTLIPFDPKDPKKALNLVLSQIRDKNLRFPVILALKKSVTLLDEKGIFNNPTAVVQKVLEDYHESSKNNKNLCARIKSILFKSGLWQKLNKKAGTKSEVSIPAIYFHSIDDLGAVE